MTSQKIATQNVDAFLDSVRVGPEGWDKIVFEFCKVEFLCWNGDPNWLGWPANGTYAVKRSSFNYSLLARAAHWRVQKGK